MVSLRDKQLLDWKNRKRVTQTRTADQDTLRKGKNTQHPVQLIMIL